MTTDHPTWARLAAACVALCAAVGTAHAQSYVPTKGTPQAYYPSSPQATGQAGYRPFIPGQYDVPCPCPFPTGYCPLPTGYCPLPNNQCGLATPQGGTWGSPQGYAPVSYAAPTSYSPAPAPVAAPCAPCAANQARGYIAPQA